MSTPKVNFDQTSTPCKENTPSTRQNEEFAHLYCDLLVSVERLHRRLMEVLRAEFERLGYSELSPHQALLLVDIGSGTISLRELRNRGCYLSSSMSYNLKKLIAGGYIEHKRFCADRRSVSICLTEKGSEVSAMVSDLRARHLQSLQEVAGITASDLSFINKTLQRLDRFWMDQVLYHL